MLHEHFEGRVRIMRVRMDFVMSLLLTGMLSSRELSLAYTSAQRATSWLGETLKHSGRTPNPYPNSRDSSNTIVEPRADTHSPESVAGVLLQVWNEIPNIALKGGVSELNLIELQIANTKELRKQMDNIIGELLAIRDNGFVAESLAGSTVQSLGANNFQSNVPSAIFHNGFIAINQAIISATDVRLWLGWDLNRLDRERKHLGGDDTQQTAVVSNTPNVSSVPVIAISFTLKSESQKLSQIADKVRGISAMYGQGEGCILVHGFMPRELVEQKGWSNEVNDILDSNFPKQVRFFDPEISIHVCRERMVEYVKSYNGRLYVIGAIEVGVAEEVALYKEAGVTIEHVAVNPVETVLTEADAPEVISTIKELEPLVVLNAIENTWPRLINEVPMPLTREQAQHVLEVFGDNHIEDIFHVVNQDHVAAMELNGKTPVISVYNYAMITGHRLGLEREGWKVDVNSEGNKTIVSAVRIAPEPAAEPEITLDPETVTVAMDAEAQGPGRAVIVKLKGDGARTFGSKDQTVILMDGIKARIVSRQKNKEAFTLAPVDPNAVLSVKENDLITLIPVKMLEESMAE